MTAQLITMTLAMSLLAAWFLLQPLVTTPRSRSRGIARLPLLIAIIAIVLGVGLYSVLGKPGMPSATPHANNTAADGNAVQVAASKTDGIAPVANLLAGLEQRLTDNPDDAKGWLLLAKSYQHLGETDKAMAAYEKAVQLGQADAALAESLLSESPVEQAVQIHGRVSLSAAAMAQANDTDIVFVFAKSVAGPPMPLAVVQRPVSELPFEFTLSDAQSMVEGNSLSNFDEVIVTAKISAPGDARGDHTDLEVKSDPVATADAPFLNLTIGPRQ